ncbi:MAG: cell division FtsZ family protein [Clostridiales bacterium]|nr:cell division FtsZ family protein [Clostridiales bacterium]
MYKIPKVKVFGVGGAGCNFIEKIIGKPVAGVKYFAVDDDCGRLQISTCENKIRLIGSDHHGADCAYAQKTVAANESLLKEAVQGADMVILVAGMGGGIGSVVTPALAQMAKSSGALTIAAVCTPFMFEGEKRLANAERGLQALRECADAVVAVPCENPRENVPQNVPVTEMIKRTDETIVRITRLLLEPVLVPQVINLEYEDVAIFLRGAKRALFGFGVGEGENKIDKALHSALNGISAAMPIADATGVFLYVEGGDDLVLNDISTIATCLKDVVNSSANILFAVNMDSGLSGKLEVSVLAVQNEI